MQRMKESMKKINSFVFWMVEGIRSLNEMGYSFRYSFPSTISILFILLVYSFSKAIEPFIHGKKVNELSEMLPRNYIV